MTVVKKKRKSYPLKSEAWIIEKMQKLAARDRRSLNTTIQLAMIDYIEKNKDN